MRWAQPKQGPCFARALPVGIRDKWPAGRSSPQTQAHLLEVALYLRQLGLVCACQQALQSHRLCCPQFSDAGGSCTRLVVPVVAAGAFGCRACVVQGQHLRMPTLPRCAYLPDSSHRLRWSSSCLAYSRMAGSEHSCCCSPDVLQHCCSGMLLLVVLSPDFEGCCLRPGLQGATSVCDVCCAPNSSTGPCTRTSRPCCCCCCHCGSMTVVVASFLLLFYIILDSNSSRRVGAACYEREKRL